ncbi:uncharacterized protein VTP21DRAFT_7271 [Calcarisporiella thermophila]|uniref:uncharacterized protein n=1 Tax=Calcarisporiella thermophila TaxID=911321 RepID=UPI003743CA3F
MPFEAFKIPERRILIINDTEAVQIALDFYSENDLINRALYDNNLELQKEIQRVVAAVVKFSWEEKLVIQSTQYILHATRTKYGLKDTWIFNRAGKETPFHTRHHKYLFKLQFVRKQKEKMSNYQFLEPHPKRRSAEPLDRPRTRPHVDVHEPAPIFQRSTVRHSSVPVIHRTSPLSKATRSRNLEFMAGTKPIPFPKLSARPIDTAGIRDGISKSLPENSSHFWGREQLDPHLASRIEQQTLRRSASLRERPTYPAIWDLTPDNQRVRRVVSAIDSQHNDALREGSRTRPMQQYKPMPSKYNGPGEVRLRRTRFSSVPAGFEREVNTKARLGEEMRSNTRAESEVIDIRGAGHQRELLHGIPSENERRFQAIDQPVARFSSVEPHYAPQRTSRMYRRSAEIEGEYAMAGSSRSGEPEYDPYLERHKRRRLQYTSTPEPQHLQRGSSVFSAIINTPLSTFRRFFQPDERDGKRV